jgi:hypothetical protein
LDSCCITGKTLHVPAGLYLISSTLNINRSLITNDDAITRFSIIGDGPGSTQLKYTGTSGSALQYVGGTSGASMHAYFTFANIRLQGTGATGTAGLLLKIAAFFTVSNFVIVGFSDGIIAEDVLACSFESCVIRFNQKGFTFYKSIFSNPNSILLKSCVIGGNSQYGILAVNPSTFNMFGGSVEGNGVNCASSGSLEGAMAANFNGVYFENNATLADIWIAAGAAAGATSVNITACTFNRVSGSVFSANNVRFDCASANKTALTLIGNGFNGFGSYVPGGNQYVAYNTGGSLDYKIAEWGNLWGQNLDIPIFPGKINNQQSVISASAIIDGSTGAIIKNTINVKTVSKTATGEYVVTFDQPLNSSTYTVALTSNTIGFLIVWAASNTTLTIRTYNISGVGADLGYVYVLVNGGLIS